MASPRVSLAVLLPLTLLLLLCLVPRIRCASDGLAHYVQTLHTRVDDPHIPWVPLLRAANATHLLQVTVPQFTLTAELRYSQVDALPLYSPSPRWTRNTLDWQPAVRSACAVPANASIDLVWMGFEHTGAVLLFVTSHCAGAWCTGALTAWSQTRLRWLGCSAISAARQSWTWPMPVAASPIDESLVVLDPRSDSGLLLLYNLSTAALLSSRRTSIYVTALTFTANRTVVAAGQLLNSAPGFALAVGTYSSDLRTVVTQLSMQYSSAHLPSHLLSTSRGDLVASFYLTAASAQLCLLPPGYSDLLQLQCEAFPSGGALVDARGTGWLVVVQNASNITDVTARAYSANLTLSSSSSSSSTAAPAPPTFLSSSSFSSTGSGGCADSLTQLQREVDALTIAVIALSVVAGLLALALLGTSVMLCRASSMGSGGSASLRQSLMAPSDYLRSGLNPLW